jgi:hypothetical protein
MKLKIMTIMLAFSLTACASGPTAFGPAQSYDDIGFRQTQIQNDRFRVSYTAPNEMEAQDFALLRAAQIALDKGYSHFEIIGGNLSGRSPRSGIGSSVGVGFGSGGYRRGGTSVGVNVGVNDVVRALEGNRVTNSIEIRLLPTKGTGPNVYEAQSLVDSIRPQVFSGP